MGQRLKWIRDKLSFQMKDVAKDCDINYFTFWAWEHGQRPTNNLKLYNLSRYYNHYWQDKFKNMFPTYQKSKVEVITLEWVVSGENETHCYFKKMWQAVHDDYMAREIAFVKRIEDLEQKIKGNK